MDTKFSPAYLPLANNQQEIWLDQQRHPQRPCYHIGGYTRIDNHLDIQLLRHAIQHLLVQHDALRLILHPPQGSAHLPYQIISEEPPTIRVPLVDLRHSDDPHKVALSWMQARMDAPPGLYKQPLFEFAVLRLPAGRDYFFYRYHHLICDGWGMGLVLRTLAGNYNALLADEYLPPEAPSYVEFLQRTRRYQESPRREADRRYWLERFRELPPALFAPQGEHYSQLTVGSSARHSCPLSREFMDRLESFSKAHGVSAFHLFIAALYGYLSRTTGQADLALDIPLLNRSGARPKQTLGVFIENIPLRLCLAGDTQVTEALSQIARTLTRDYRHQHFSSAELQRELIPGGQPGQRLCQVRFSYADNLYDAEFDGIPGYSVPLVHSAETIPLDIHVRYWHRNTDIQLDVVYHRDYFQPTDAARLSRGLLTLLEGILVQPSARLADLPLLDARDITCIRNWNTTSSPTPAPSVVALFERQVARSPEALALVCNQQTLSYTELHQAVNALARQLQQRGIGPGQRVGVCLGRSPTLLVALLGVLRSGAAYVPLDPQHPRARLELVLRDADISLLLSDQAHADRSATPPGVELLCLDDELPTTQAHQTDLPALPGPQDPAYLIYTSGSTGVPKGVSIPHAALANLLHGLSSQLALSDQDRWLAVTTVAFDIAALELFGPLCVGARVVLAGHTQVNDAQQLATLIEQHNITFMQATPASWRLLLANRWAGRADLHILCGGEALEPHLADQLLSRGASLWNLYGPTETTIWSSAARLHNAQVHIGQPIANTRCYILDPQHQLLPPGIPGELAIAGAGLALGYHQRAELNAQRFIELELLGQHERVYLTGDLARWRDDGCLQHLGRIDQQIKLRGFRIEPGEIEQCLLALNDIREAVVVRAPDAERLNAYLLVNTTPDQDSLRQHLRQHLPEYMLPATYTVLDALPLTPNGKIDRQALPAPHATRISTPQGPRTPTEETLLALWEQLLNLPVESITANFFDIGGHSLIATQMISRVVQQLGVELPLAVIFEHPVLADLARWIDTQQRGGSLPDIPLLAPNAPLELSYAQQRMWVICQLDYQRPAYHMDLVLDLRGPLDQKALEMALATLVERHDSLRMSFPVVDNQPSVALLAPYSPLEIIPLGELEPSVRESAQQRWQNDTAHSPFDLSQGPLLRTRLLELGKQQHQLLITLHHIIADGWSLTVLCRELSALYQTPTQPLPPLRCSYPAVATWQRQQLHSMLNRQLDYWRNALEGAPTRLDLPCDHPRAPHSSQQSAFLHTQLDESLSRQLRHLATDHNASLFMVLLAAFGLLLSRYSAQQDLLIGSPVANRLHPQTEDLVGLFINTLVLRVQPHPQQRFSDLLASVRDTTLGAQAHQALPFEQLVEALSPQRSLDHHPLIQVMFDYQQDPLRTLQLPGVQATMQARTRSSSEFDLLLSVEPRGDRLMLSWEYLDSLFERHTIERLNRHFLKLLHDLPTQAHHPLAKLVLLDAEELRQLRHWSGLNQHAETAPTTVVALFQRQAQQTPERVALVWDQQQISYQQLEQQSTRLATALRHTGVRSGERVGIYLPEGPQRVIAVLGVLRACAAFVPLDPAHPPARLRLQLRQAEVAWVIVDAQDTFPVESTLPLLSLNELSAQQGASQQSSLPLPDPEQLAYIIHTSGSTGSPRAVAVEHRGWAQLQQAYEQVYQLSETHAHLQLAAFSFDVFAAELSRALCSGARLVLCPAEIRRDPPRLAALLRQHAIDVADMVPALVRALSAHLQTTEQQLDGLRLLLVGSDSWYPADLRGLRQICGRDTQIINAYGVTEASIDNLHFDTAALGPEHSHGLPIGTPLPGLHAHVLDALGQLQPIGVPGELCLGGDYLARGYHGEAQLTATRFPQIALFGETHRLYRSGDRARWRADGQLEFLGRLDRQIKIRGIRVEPGEIETLLSDHPQVHTAAVVWRVEEQRLDAYFTAASPAPDSAALRQHLGERLPGFMIPASFTILDSLPLTSSGKIDRNALPAPVLQESALRIAPRSTTEEILLALWRELLPTPVDSITAHFFEAGGHSLMATQLAGRIRQHLQMELPLSSLFEYPVLADLARWLDDQRRGTPLAAITPLTTGQPLPLSFAQQRLWFLARLDGSSALYNMPTALALQGELDASLLEHSLNELIRCQHSLRLCFPEVDGCASATLLPAYQPLEQLECPQRADLQQHMQELAHTEFDLQRGPLLRARLLRLAPCEHVLLVTVHHIVSDGWSMQIFFETLFRHYRVLLSDPTASLKAPTIQYPDVAAWQQRELNQAVLAGQRRYWLETLADTPTLLELPGDFPRPPRASHRGGIYTASLDANAHQRLQDLARQHQLTPFMALLGAFSLLLARHSGQEDILIGTPVAGRQHPQCEELIGLFVNTLALRTRPQLSSSVREFLAQIRRLAIDAYAHQDLPFEQLVEELNPERSLAHSPIFQVMLVVQNAPPPLASPVDLSITPMQQSGYDVARFDLTLDIEIHPDALSLRWEYATDLFQADTIQRMHQHFLNLLEGLASDPVTQLTELSWLSPREIDTLQAWNDTATPLPTDTTVVDLFLQHVSNTPTATALVVGEQTLSYAELNRRANRVAHELLCQGLGRGDLVGLCLERSADMISALLGVLQAGCAYLPLDPQYPAERLRFMLEDAGIALLISNTRIRLPLDTQQTPRLDLEQLPPDTGQSYHSIAQRTTPDDLAYVIYTSGSTGQPKGVMIEHRGWLNLSLAQVQAFGIEAKSRVLQFASLNFDASASEIGTALISGASLVIIDVAQLLEPEHFAPLLRQYRVSHATLPPSLIEALTPPGDALANLILAGEASSAALVGRWASGRRLLNAYGPTEVTVCASISEPLDGQVLPPIGKPLANTRLYVLDAWRQPLPVGIPGELAVAGVGLARGYLARPELNAKCFPNLHLLGRQERVYLTGDRVRWRTDGQLEFLGRIDQQLKIRGMRIEPGEIEATLCDHPAVQKAVVVLDSQGQRLDAYLILREALADTELLREHLRQRLPDYMIPASYTRLEALPLTPNAKLDRNALPAPRANTSSGPIAPRTPTEQMLLELWTELLPLTTEGVKSNFFDVGGHSLLATQLISRIRQHLAIEVPLTRLFDHPVLAELARWIDTQQRGAPLPDILPIRADEPMQLSFAQQRLWFLAQLEGASSNYHMSAALRLTGVLHIEALGESFRRLVEHQQSLRLVFPVDDGEPTLRELPPYTPLLVSDLRHLHATERQSTVERLAHDHASIPFDLASGPLLRVSLLRITDTEQVLLINMHHIISDGWSIGVLIREWVTLYTALNQGQVPDLAPLPIRYSDYAAWQRQWLQGTVLQGQLDYWRESMRDAPRLLELPTDRPRPAVQSHRGAVLRSRLDAVLTEQLHALGRQLGTTLFMTLLAALNVLLHRYTGQSDVLIGSPIANRTQRHVEGLIGLFVNTLVLRTRIDAYTPFSELLTQVRHTALGAYAHQDLPFETLVEQLNPERSLSHHPLFQVMFALQNNDNTELVLPGLEIIPLEQTTTMANFDLTLDVVENTDGLLLTWEYATDLFDAARIKRMAEHFAVLLHGIVEHPDTPIGQLALLTNEEITQLRNWNQTEARFRAEQTVVDLFEAQGRATPAATAVVFEDTSLSYAELNARANQLAHALINRGVGADQLVGLCVERSLEMFIGLLGILKAGGAYVPLDPAYPTERLRFMVKDSAVAVLLSQSWLADRLPASEAEHLWLDQATTCADQPDHDPGRRSDPEHLAYVIYTSGSTGQPKGVMVEHQSLAGHCQDTRQHYGISATDRVLQFASFSFDASIEEIFCTWLSGATLVVPADNRLDPESLTDQLRHHRVNVMELPPAYWQQLCEIPDGEHRLENLQLLALGGEALPSELARRTRQRFPTLTCLNTYGPTETTITATTFRLPTAEQLEENTSIPIGRPLTGTPVYLLDRQLQPVPLGVAGELCLGGFRVARGYLNRPELTAERFVEVALFGQRERLYRSGDLARWLPDGNLDYLGRIDHQVKLRGFRIELGEIEAVLTRHDAVREAVVVLHPGETEPMLVAYMVASGDNIEPTELRTWLRTQLPDYMIPAHFLVLDALPLTPNGKLDRQALPEPQTQPSLASAAPRTPTEHLLMELWRELLPVQVNRVDSNFFDLGGHSLLATQLLSRIRQHLAVEVPLTRLFDHPVLADLARWLDDQQRGAPLPPIKSLAEDTPRVLSFAQQRMWLLGELENNPALYNMPAALHLQGPLNTQALQQALAGVIARHESLRQCFPMVAGQPSAALLAPYSPLEVVSLAAGSPDERMRQLQQHCQQMADAPFDLARGPLLRAQLICLDHQTHALLLTLHHIISDGWSMELLFAELFELYQTLDEGRQPDTTPLPIQYTDVAAWQRNHLAGEILDTQRRFWLDTLADAPTLLELPTDFPRPARASHQGGFLQHPIDARLATQLRQCANEHHLTPFMLVLAAFGLLLQRYSGQHDLLIATPVAGRQHPQTEPLIGLFVNTLVLRLQPQPAMSVADFLQQLRKTTLSAQAHQDLPFEQLVEELNPQRSLAHSPVFQVMITMQTGTRETTAKHLRVTPLEGTHSSVHAKFDLTLHVDLQPDSLSLGWEFATDLFRPQTIQRFHQHLNTLLQAMLADLNAPLERLSLMSPEEAALLQRWQSSEPLPTVHTSVVDLFEQQVHQRPHDIALVAEQQQLSYTQLNTLANRLAHALIQRGLGPGDLLGLSLPRSVELIVGVLGILKAGCAYLPLDPDYPTERLRFMLDDAAASLLISQAKPLGTNTPHLDINTVLSTQDTPLNPPRRHTGNDPAYVIYTSGSSGTPKGVIIPHSNIIQLFRATEHCYHFGPDEVWTLFHSYAFDFSVWEIWGALAHGGRLVIVSYQTSRDPHAFYRLLLDQQVTVLNQTPSAFRQLIPVAAQNEPSALHLRWVIFGGEALDLPTLKPWFQHHGDRQPQLVNMYGITETTVHTTYHPLDANACEQPSQCIGVALRGTRLYVLDANHLPLPVGIPGELAVAGSGLAQAYLNRPALNAQRFVELSLFGETQRVYLSGDRVRWLDDGTLEYLGRIDQQIKLRGFRIEPGEIETALASSPSVREAVVVLHPQPQRLDAYLTVNTPIDHDRLRDHLRERLPDYMIPATFTVLDALPLTPNGKLNRAALPEPASSTESYLAPRNDTEQQLALIWQQLLGHTRVGVDDNFFELGGDSIISIQVVARARQAGIELQPRDLFEHQCIAELALAVRPRHAVVLQSEPQPGAIPLTPIQHWFLAAPHNTLAHFNQSVLLAVPPDLDTEALRDACAALLTHHHSLRLRFSHHSGHWQQHYSQPETTIPLEIDPLNGGVALASRASHWQASLDITRGPLCRWVLFPSAKRLLWCIHHLAVDAVSWPILLEDLARAYAHARAGQHPVLPAPTSSFQHWAQCLNDWHHTDSYQRQTSFWQVLPREAPSLPLDRPNGALSQAHIEHHNLTLCDDQTRALQQTLPSAYRLRVHETLITALAMTLRRWSGQSPVLIDLESHGRTDLFETLELSRTVGWFTAIHTVALSLPSDDPGACLKAVKEQLRAIPYDGVGDGVGRWLAGESRVCAPVLFNFLGQHDRADESHELFPLVDEDRGIEHHPQGAQHYPLEINAGIYQGQLQLSWSYSREQCETETLHRLVANFQQQLLRLIEHARYHGGYTPADFPLATVSQSLLDQLYQQHQRNLESLYPASPMQQGLLFHTLEAPSGGYYIEQFHTRLENIHPQSLKHAWQRLVARHPILRTAFLMDQQPPLQYVLREIDLPWQNLDWRERTADQQTNDLQKLLDQERRQGFALDQAPLMRFQLIHEDPQHHRLVWHHHHALLDGWSIPRVLHEMDQIYQALVQGGEPKLPPLRPYQHYIAWLQQQNLKTSRNYWQQRLAGLEGPTLLPLSRPDSSSGEPRYRHHSHTLAAQPFKLLQRFARTQRLTLNTLIQGAWAVLIGRYTNSHDVVIGTTISGRQIPLGGVESMVGLFINTLPLRVALQGSVLEMLQTLQRQQQQDNQHAQLPLAEIQQCAGFAHATALFDTLVIVENYPDQPPGEETTTDGEAGDTREFSHYPLGLAVIPGEELRFTLNYDSHNLDPAAMAPLLAQFSTLLAAIPEHADTAADELPILTEQDIHCLRQWNSTTRELPANTTLLTLVEQQASVNPDTVAVVNGDNQLSYAALNRQANQLAHRLIAMGHGPGEIIGLCLERSETMIIALLGVLKAGCAYLPLDPDYPRERLQFILDDAGATRLITTHKAASRLKASDIPRIYLDAPPPENIPQDNPTPRVTADELAYVIYTSGSTGNPKGVMIEHRGWLNLILAEQRILGLQAGSRNLQFASLNFDASVFEIGVTLATGATLYLMSSQQTLDPTALAAWLERMQISHATLPPTLLNNLPAVASLHTLVVAGEALPGSLARRWTKGRRLFNAYGPTEVTVCASISDPLDNPITPPIGRPIDNTRLYVLDARLQPLPVGVPGELAVASVGLARGYLNRPELTAERFRQLQLLGRQERVYLTGDRVRWLADGQLEFLGRLDQQIKLRGYRIEPGEIEATLVDHPAVGEAVVVMNEQTERLDAYLTTTANAPSEQQLRDHLRAHLPTYMIPATFTVLDQLPLTPNGKLDRRKLPQPDTAGAPRSGYVAPRNLTEQRLLVLWQKLLGRLDMGVQDNFFDLGGHSLTAMQMMAQIAREWKQELPLATLLRTPTVASLAAHLSSPGGALSSDGVVQIRSASSGPAVWFLPGVGGNVLYAHALAQHLDAAHPVYGLEPPGLAGDKPINSVASLANYQLEKLLACQPTPPFHLIGHSFGGLVAFEMACQLASIGFTDIRLVLLDCQPPGTYTPEAALDEQRVFAALLDDLAYRGGMVCEDTQVEDLLAHGLLHPDDLQPARMEPRLATYQASLVAAANYYPTTPVAAPVLLLEARDGTPADPSMAMTAAWSRHFRTKVDHGQISGDHFSMLTPPHVAELARCIRRFLEARESFDNPPV